MKFFIASDIHGSAYYCQEMLTAYENEGADKLIILGDILYHGPRNDLPEGYAPKKVIEMLNPLKDKIMCVRGNCDAEVDQMVLNFPIMADYALLPVNNKTATPIFHLPIILPIHTQYHDARVKSLWSFERLSM